MDAAVGIQVDYELERNFQITENSNGEIRVDYAVTNLDDRPITELRLFDSLSDLENAAIRLGGGSEAEVVDRGLPAFGQRRLPIKINASRLIAHPTEPRLIALMNQEHSVAVIDTVSQQVEKVVWVGTHPTGGSFSPDYSEFFVATSTASQLAVLSTSSWELARIVELDFTPLDIATGANGQLLISDGSMLHQIDPLTGDSVGTTIDQFNADRVHVLSDGKTVFATTKGSRFAREYDLSIDPPVVSDDIERRHSDETYLGDMQVTADDRLILQRSRSLGTNGISVFDRQSMRFAMFFPLESGDVHYTISSDSRFVYVENGDQIKVWNLRTFENVGAFDAFGTTNSISLDSNDEFVYRAQDNRLHISTVGRTKGDTADSYPSWNAVVDPGEAWHFEGDRSYYDAQNPNNRSQAQRQVTALASFDGDPSESVSETYEVAVDLEQLFLGASFKTGPFPAVGPSIAPEGQPLAWTVAVKPSGPFSYQNVEVIGVFGSERSELPAHYIDGDRNLNQQLDPLEIWHFAVTEVTGADHGHAEFRAVASSASEGVPTAEGSIHRYFEFAASTLDLDFRVVAPRDADAETVDPLRTSSGDPLRWQYRVTNDGNYPIESFSLNDTRSPANDSRFSGSYLNRVDPRSLLERAGDLVLRYPPERNIRPQALALHPTQRLLYFADGREQEIVAIDFAAPFPMYTIDIGVDVRRLIFDPYWERLYFITDEGVVRAIDVATRQLLSEQITTSAVDIAVDSTGNLFVYKNDSIDRFDARRFEPISSIAFESSCGRIAIYDKYLAVHAHYASVPGTAVFDIQPRTPLPVWNSVIDRPYIGGCKPGKPAFTEDADGEAYVYAFGAIDQERAMTVKRRLRDGHNVGAVSVSGGRVLVSQDERQIYTLENGDGRFSSWNTDTLRIAGYFRVDDSSGPRFANYREFVWDDVRGLIIYAGLDEIAIFDVGRPAYALLAGDDNFNAVLDPGETWLFEIAGTAVSGEHQVTATLRWLDPRNQFATSVGVASYVATSQLQSVSASVSENVAGIEVLDLAERGMVDALRSLTTTHPDFEIVDGILKLRPTAYLSVAKHDGLSLWVENAQTGERLAKVLLSVTENSFAFHNGLNRFDVKFDGQVTALDALVIINVMSRGIAGKLPAFRYADTPFYDVNRDANVSSVDALQIINQLARLRWNLESEAEFAPTRKDDRRLWEPVEAGWNDPLRELSLF